MAVAEMSKLNLVAMAYERDLVLNTLHHTGATEIKLHSETENTAPMISGGGELKEYLSGLEGALDILTRRTEGYLKANKIKSDVLKDGFTVSYTDFMSCKDFGGEADILVARIYELNDTDKSLGSELAKLNQSIAEAEIYSHLDVPLGSFADTAYTRIKLGTVPLDKKDALQDSLEDDGLAACSTLNISGDSALMLIAAHKSDSESAEAVQNAGFTPCPFGGDMTGAELYASLLGRREELQRAIAENDEKLCGLQNKIKILKTYIDYIGFELEKQELSEKMRATEVTVLLEAYVPKEAEKEVAAALDNATGAIYYEFTEPSEDEMPPTLYKNNAVVKNFETITNMYSPVNSREFDPNAVMAFFYSLFLGFIMADIGYGLLMLVGGMFIYLKQKRDCGMKRLAGVFAAGGVFALIWGVLFNSLFGCQPLPFTIIPDAKDVMWSLAGIKVPAVLIISLVIGVVQLFAGYICLTVQCWRRGRIADGIFDGVTWAFFSVGAGLAIVGFVEEANLSVLSLIGGILAGVSLLVAMLTAGRKEKLIGKFTKGFGAAYGIINYASDILSYARLYGLMLSGAVIAQIVSTYSIDFIMGGNPLLIILGILLMVIGHGFNLAIGLLGAYIHDARLQYVEFYGRFYEGEGELFAPLGSKHKYVYVSENL